MTQFCCVTDLGLTDHHRVGRAQKESWKGHSCARFLEPSFLPSQVLDFAASISGVSESRRTADGPAF